MIAILTHRDFVIAIINVDLWTDNQWPIYCPSGNTFALSRWTVLF